MVFKHFLSKINTLFEITVYALIYSVLASGDFCRLLINFANNFDPDHDRHIKLFHPLVVFLKHN